MLKGQPAYYSRYGNGIQLYMVPDQAYPVVINGTNGNDAITIIARDSSTHPGTARRCGSGTHMTPPPD